MTRIGKKRRKSTNTPQVLGLALVGIGLLVLGGLSFLLLPRPEPASRGSTSSVPVEVDYPAPDLSLKNLDGKVTSLADYQDQVVLVNNWATWCPPCKAEMPTLQAYYEAHAADGFTIIAIDAGDPELEVAAFVEAFGLTFPVWVDPASQALRTFRNNALPNSYVIARGGQVRLTWTGEISRDMLEKYVTPLIK